MVGTLEEHLDMARKKAPAKPEPIVEEPPLSEMDRAIIGEKSVRVDIPFTGSYKVRRIGEMLVALGETLKAMSHRHEWTERQRLFLMKNEVINVQKRIRELHGHTNKNGTFRKGS